MFKILAIDGGGIKGIIPSIILVEIEKRTSKRIVDLFDILAGTSTGAIATLALAKKYPYPASKVLELYTGQGGNVFSRSVFHKIKTGWGFFGPKYESSGIENIFKQYFGDSKLSECLKTVIVPSFNITEEKPYFFKNGKNASFLSPVGPFNEVIPFANDFCLSTVLRAATAAPSYFAPYEINSSLYIDGGVFANNPSMCAITDAISEGIPAQEISLVSLGCGVGHTDRSLSRNWGLMRWAKPLVEIVFDLGVVDYQCRQFLTKYWRIQTELSKETRLDSVGGDDVEMLVETANDLIKVYDRHIDAICSHVA